MNRRAAAILFVVTGLALTVALVLGRDTDGQDYRLAVSFDTAKGMVPGQLVKIAGARVGKVTAVHLAAGPSAQISLTVDRRFAPFRADASCQILPEGFISENYVQCDPGRSSAPLAEQDGTPTIRRERTSVPVSLQDVLDIFSLPVDARIRAVVNELGIGTAGRGPDINAILRRANPALTQANQLLTVLREQRDTLADAVTQSDSVLARVAANRDDVRRFVGRAADVTVTTARHARPLSAAVQRLPRLLERADRGLAAVRRATTAGTPLLADLRVAAPEVRELTDALPRVTAAATPAIRALGQTGRRGRSALRASRVALTALQSTARVLQPVSGTLGEFLTSLRDTGGIDNVLHVVYTLANVASGYDGVSHQVAFFPVVSGPCLVNPAKPGCSHSYAAPGQGTVPVNTLPAAGVTDTRARALLDFLLR